MNRWCKNLMLVAAMAVVAPGCAQSRSLVGQSAILERSSSPAPPKAVSVAEKVPDIHERGSSEDAANSSGRLKIIQTAFQETPPGEPQPDKPETPQPDTTESGTPLRDVPGAGARRPADLNAPLGTEPKLTLEYLSRLAVDNHPLLRRDEARIEAAAGGALQAGLYPNPRFDSNNPQVFNGQNTALNVGIQQDIVVKGKLRLDRAAALKVQQQSEFALVQDRYTLLAQVRNQYYQTLAAQYRVEVLRRLLTVTELSVTIGKELVKAGTGDEAQVKLLEIDDNRVQADLFNARRMLAGEREQLAAIVGFPGVIDQDLVGSLTATPPAFNEEFMRQFVTAENAQVQIARLDIDKSRLLLQRAEAEPYPNITVGPGYQYGFNKAQEQYWMTIVFPIPVSDRNQGNIRSARASIKDSAETLGAVQLDLLKRVADSYSTHRGAVEQAERYRTQIIPDGREALRLARSGYRQGVFEFSVYLQAQRTVIDATKDYVDILEKMWTSAADLSGLLQMEQFP
jgi:cobalt-zinc-cadmium efflux system outer membrane protein